MNLVQLLINGISYSQTQNGAYALILSEIEGERKLPIVIGTNEAQSIAIAIEKEIKPPRPLTHDLFKNFCVRFDIKIKQVIIHKLVDGVFYSSVICERDGIEEIIDSRSSDAIALAIRFEAPIYTYENILKKAGVVLKIEKEIDERLSIAGIEVLEARIGYLAYAQEIANAMLKRQQATAIVAARHKIVEGAVSMVEMAIEELNKNEVVELDEERKAAMVSNLMVVLCGDKDASPVVNTGTLSH